MSLAAYLAKNYLTADTNENPHAKKSKKRKRASKRHDGLTIEDDDASIIPDAHSHAAEDDEDAPVLVGNTSAFRKTKQSAWRTVGSSTPTNAEQVAADAILASAAAESAALAEAAATEEAPQVVMENGARGGLQTAAEAAALDRRRRDEEIRNMKATSKANATETIYRDASGRIINVAMARAEARRKAEDEEKRLAEEKQRVLKGDAQTRREEEQRQELREAKFLTVARGRDDAELNRELKEQERWNDPAMKFLSSSKHQAATAVPAYKGAAAPNRYGIRPGHMWDGVDRSNGFEKRWFATRNERKDREELEYAWQMDE